MNIVRLQQRFEFFQRAFLNLDEVKQCEQRAFSNLEKEGIIQRFEIAIELSWKVIKDFLQNEGFAIKSPKESMRQAFAYGLIQDCEAWLEALDMRNITSHTYTQAELDKNVAYILESFYPLIQKLYLTLQNSTSHLR